MARIKKFPGIRGLAGVAAVESTFDASDFFDDVEDEDVAVEPSRYADPHSVVMKFLNAQQRGGTLKIGRQTFRVENAHGGTVYVTKSPGAGRKLYTLKLVAFEPIEFVVDEVSSGSGVSLNNPPVARFSLDADGKLAGLGAQIARVSVYDDDAPQSRGLGGVAGLHGDDEQWIAPRTFVPLPDDFQSDAVYTQEHLEHMLDLQIDEIRAAYKRSGDKPRYNYLIEQAYAEHHRRLMAMVRLTRK